MSVLVCAIKDIECTRQDCLENGCQLERDCSTHGIAMRTSFGDCGHSMMPGDNCPLCKLGSAVNLRDEWQKRFEGQEVLTKSAQAMTEHYSDVLRELCSYFGVGGFNSEGLMPPEVALEKIRWGADFIVGVETKRREEAESRLDYYRKALEEIVRDGSDTYGIVSQAAQVADHAMNSVLDNTALTVQPQIVVEGRKCGACYEPAEPGSEYCTEHQPEPYHPGGECVVER